MTSFLIVAAFVYGVSTVLNGFCEFFSIDLDDMYERSPMFVRFIMKPTIYCNVCMSSFWGSICYFAILAGDEWQGWILHCVISAALISIVNRFRW